MDKEKILEAFKDYLGLDSKDEVPLDKVILNSSAIGTEESIDLIMYLEEKLGVELTEKDLESIYTIEDIVKYITKKEETR
ncbi:hypothetical protein DRN73_07130 [Candidatus Pacearchaeota archaeon]|nr:MAG: hypothetical protein DRN73_07130 [Candidatus Pacearchaeota archaeon]